jgi:hypothetical protein
MGHCQDSALMVSLHTYRENIVRGMALGSQTKRVNASTILLSARTMGKLNADRG